MSDPPARVRVTGPPRRGPRPASPTHADAPDGLDADSSLGALYAGSLLRAQAAQAARTLAALVLLVGSLPLLFWLLPASSDVVLLGVPLPWLALGVAVHPVLLVLGWWHLRRAERVERDLLALLRREDDG